MSGNFSASTGKAKSKKTFNVAAIVGASLVNGKVLGYTAEFPDDKRIILYFDTEQSPYHCQEVIERALRLAKLPTDTHPEHLKFAALRQLTPALRLEVIEQAIISTPGVGLVIIDGVRDLMYDINCAKESTDLIGKLMEWTDKFQIHIHTVLHLNKSDDNVRGHVGTELNNKAETVLLVSRSKTDDTVSEVCAAMIRAAEFDPFAFRVNDYGLPEIASGYVFTEPGKKAKYGLTYSPLKEKYEQKKPVFKTKISAAIYGCKSWDDFIRRLACAGIDVKFHDDHNTGEHIGVRFSDGDITMNGSKIDHAFTYRRLNNLFELNRKQGPCRAASPTPQPKVNVEYTQQKTPSLIENVAEATIGAIGNLFTLGPCFDQEEQAFQNAIKKEEAKRKRKSRKI